MNLIEYLEQSRQALSRAIEYPGTENVNSAVAAIVAALRKGQPLLVCGNGGSASDAMHISGELVGRFLKERRAINCICLTSNTGVLTAWSNDYSYDTVFARQVEAYGQSGGVLLGISTSGNSQNVIKAFERARELNVLTVGLTGRHGGKLAPLSDVLVDVPSDYTPIVQQLHICIYHFICYKVEENLLTDGV